MKLIPVGKNYHAMVSDEDYPWILDLGPWAGSPDADGRVYARKRKVKMERMVTLDFDSYCIDHKDGNTLNNQRDNLRPATEEQNGSNRRDKKVAGPNGFGVRHDKRGFLARVRLFGKSLDIGPFTDAESAQRAYDALKFLTVGEFGPLNKPQEVQESIVALKEYMQTQRREYIQKVVRMLGSKREAAKALGLSEASIYREDL